MSASSLFSAICEVPIAAPTTKLLRKVSRKIPSAGVVEVGGVGGAGGGVPPEGGGVGAYKKSVHIPLDTPTQIG